MGGKCGGSVGVPVQAWRTPCQLVCWLLRDLLGLGEADRCLNPRESGVLLLFARVELPGAFRHPSWVATMELLA